MQFVMIVKQGKKELGRIEGGKLNPAAVDVDDFQKVIEVEQWLERMFGHRFHIQEGV